METSSLDLEILRDVAPSKTYLPDLQLSPIQRPRHRDLKSPTIPITEDDLFEDIESTSSNTSRYTSKNRDGKVFASSPKSVLPPIQPDQSSSDKEDTSNLPKKIPRIRKLFIKKPVFPNTIKNISPEKRKKFPFLSSSSDEEGCSALFKTPPRYALKYSKKTKVVSPKKAKRQWEKPRRAIYPSTSYPRKKDSVSEKLFDEFMQDEEKKIDSETKMAKKSFHQMIRNVKRRERIRRQEKESD